MFNYYRFGMHETYDYYLGCAFRERNKGLFTADRVRNIDHYITDQSELAYQHR